MAKKPQFAAANAWTVDLPAAKLELGNPALCREIERKHGVSQLKLRRDDFKKLIDGTTTKFHIGTAAFTFTFTNQQLSTLKAVVAISEPK